MAKIFPERPPAIIRDDPLRSSELKVFTALKDLPKSYLVFYNTHWQKHNPYIGTTEGEADFIIAHPDKGIIVIEVKGGAIRYDSEFDKWYSQDRQGDIHEIKDPVGQGRRSHYKLIDDFRTIPGWPNNFVNMWHAVCFPDIVIREGQYLRADLPREQVIDKEDLDHIDEYVEKMFAYEFGQNMAENAPGQVGIQIIERFLANSFEFSTPLGVEIEQEDEKLIELTEQQFRALSLLGDRHRAAIAGCAGSGKTMLAVRKAQQFAALDMNVLFVCFNKGLANYLESRLPDVNVSTFHGLCENAAQQVHQRIDRSQDQTKLFTEVYPQILMDASEEMGRVYDAIIVDEGQDFHENYWIALESLLKADGYFYVFFDDNQNLFHGASDFGGLISEPAFPLTQNCRNTKLIHNLVKRFHNDPEKLLSYAPDGRDPKFILCSDDHSVQRNLQKLLYQLIEEEHVNNQDLIILTSRSQDKSCIPAGSELGNFLLVGHPPTDQYQVQVSSIYRFKGLEKRVVILAEIDKRITHDLEMLLYVGCSRARTHLIILHDESVAHYLTGNPIPET
jgi:hypothetical protein